MSILNKTKMGYDIMTGWDQDKWDSFGLNNNQLEILDDHIFNREIKEGLKFLSEATGMPLKAIMEYCHERHLYLRKKEPDKFICSYDAYYKDKFIK